MTEPIILGATGRVGQALARVCPTRHLAKPRERRGDPAVSGDAVQVGYSGGPPPLLHSATSMIVLAGVMGQDVDALARNTDIALAAVRAARTAGIKRIFVASTQAVHGTNAAYVSEDDPCTSTAPSTAKPSWRWNRPLPRSRT